MCTGLCDVYRDVCLFMQTLNLSNVLRSPRDNEVSRIQLSHAALGEGPAMDPRESPQEGSCQRRPRDLP